MPLNNSGMSLNEPLMPLNNSEGSLNEQLIPLNDSEMSLKKPLILLNDSLMTLKQAEMSLCQCLMLLNDFRSLSYYFIELRSNVSAVSSSNVMVLNRFLFIRVFLINSEPLVSSSFYRAEASA